MEDITIGFIGFGLIGGSIAKALKAANPAIQMIAYNYHAPSPNKSLLLAKENGILDCITDDLRNGFSQCSIVFLCAPVLDNIHYLKQLKGILPAECILTDVGSVKGRIQKAAEEAGFSRQFIGGHPMAGSEQTGYENASASLLENAFYVLAPSSEVPKEALSKMEAIVTMTGALPVILDSEYHDDIVAAISHVPHMIAASLVNMVRTEDGEDAMMHQLAAGGFRDLTRIASSSPIMWQNISLTNRESILKFLSAYSQQLTHLQELLSASDGDGLLSFFEAAKEYRDLIPNKPIGLISKVYEVYVDIIDETGAIATIATILACNGINIKNIGILHNREFESGVLRIELPDQDSTSKTVDLLKNYHYTIYER